MNHILVIEDQEDVRELIAYNLKKQNYEVIEAANANDALILLEDVSLDLVLLDLMLPGLSGLDFLKILKAKDEYRQLAVIILSAKTEEQEVVTGLKLGADDYVTKPFSIKVLLAKIESVLRRVSQREEDVLTYQDIRLHQDEHKVFSGKEEVILTNKEFELLLLFLKKPKKIFEIGTFEGGTTLIMAMNSPEAEIYTLDLPWINQPDRKEEIGNSNQFYIDNRKKIVFEDTHYAKRITRLFGDSSDFPIRGHAHSIDFVFVDGCHTEHYIKNDTDKAFEMVSSGGIIVWHDYDPTEHSCWDCVFNHLNEISSLGIHHITGTAIAFYRKDK